MIPHILQRYTAAITGGVVGRRSSRAGDFGRLIKRIIENGQNDLGTGNAHGRRQGPSQHGMIQDTRQDNRPSRRQGFQNGVGVFDTERHQESASGPQECDNHGPPGPSPAHGSPIGRNKEQIDWKTRERQLKIAFPNGELEGILFNDFFEINGRKARQDDFRHDGDNP